MSYLDRLTDAYANSSNLKRLVLGLSLATAVQAITISILVSMVIQNMEKTRYILSPGIAALTVVRPGELSDSYIEESYRHISNLLNGWTYESISGNYASLFKHFYSPELVTKTQANLRTQNYLQEVTQRKLISFWRIIPQESEFHWCGEVEARREIKGVACGIVTGEQSLFADHNIPIKKEKISYLIYAVNVAPTPTNLFAIEINRLKRGPLLALKEELARSLKDGLLPLEDNL